MVAFSNEVLAQLTGPTVRMSSLVTMDFRSGPMSVWGGFGDLVIGSTTYKGIGKAGSLSPANSGPGGAVEELTLQLFGDETLLDHYAEDSLESAGREMSASFAFFDIRPETDWQLLSADTLAFFWGTMGPLIAERAVVQVGERAQRILTVRCANAFLNRRKPPMGFWSHRDQTGRGDGTDRLFIRASQTADVVVEWPNF